VAAQIAKLKLSRRQQERWLDILSTLMNKPVNQGFSAELQRYAGELMDGAALMALLPIDVGTDTVWMANLRRLLADWVEESNGLPRPMHLIEEYLYESLAEQRRARSLGDGLLLTTVHGVKGLEFDHVLVLGDWRQAAVEEIEDERRLYYVAMSRARETLHLFAGREGDNPHVALLSGEYCVVNRPSLAAVPAELGRRTLLGMQDLFIDFAGTKSEHHRERLAVERLHTGDALTLRTESEHVVLVAGGIVVGRLSRKAALGWRHRLPWISTARVVAMVRRSSGDIEDAAFRSRCHGDHWQVPIVEVHWQPPPVGGYDQLQGNRIERRL
jgi:ATP-dependent DNA helicase RecQ